MARTKMITRTVQDQRRQVARQSNPAGAVRLPRERIGVTNIEVIF